MQISRLRILCFIVLVLCGGLYSQLSMSSHDANTSAKQRTHRKRKHHIAKKENEPDYLQRMAIAYQVGTVACLGSCCASIFVGPWLAVPLALTGAVCFASCYNSVERFLELQLTFSNIVRHGFSALIDTIAGFFSKKGKA